MKSINKFQALILVVLAFAFSGCQAIAGIFKAGVWTGIFIVVIIIGLIMFLVSKASRKD